MATPKGTPEDLLTRAGAAHVYMRDNLQLTPQQIAAVLDIIRVALVATFERPTAPTERPN